MKKISSSPFKLGLLSLLLLVGLSASSARAALIDPSGSDAFEQKLSDLYDHVKANFEANPDFKNAANPTINNSSSRVFHAPELPEYQMPSLETFKWAMKSYCSLMQSSSAGSVHNKKHLGLMDYTQNSLVRRFYVYDVPSQSFIHNTWGTHADNSTMDVGYSLDPSSVNSSISNPHHDTENVLDLDDKNNARFFSNRGHSEISTLGMTVAQTSTYASSTFNSDALRIAGLDGNLNSSILGRAIVLHAWGMNSQNTRYGQSLARSEGCLMFSYDDFWEGQEHVEVYKKIIESLYGSPLILYHERMTSPEKNEQAKAEQMSMYLDLQNQLRQNLMDLAQQYGFTDAQRETLKNKYMDQLKSEVLSKINETYEYFKRPSKFIGKNPQSEDRCLSDLGL